MQNFASKLLSTFVLGYTLAAATCADPSLAVDYYTAFSAANTFHILRPRWDLVANSAYGTEDWQLQGKIFQAWETPQNFTVPIWEMGNSAGTDFTFLASATAAGVAPVASGYTAWGIVGYVYPAQTCNSVPLLIAQWTPAATDHWLTTDPVEHASLLANGWIDGGIGGYVLPIPSWYVSSFAKRGSRRSLKVR